MSAGNQKEEASWNCQESTTALKSILFWPSTLHLCLFVSLSLIAGMSVWAHSRLCADQMWSRIGRISGVFWPSFYKEQSGSDFQSLRVSEKLEWYRECWKTILQNLVLRLRLWDFEHLLRWVSFRLSIGSGSKTVPGLAPHSATTQALEMACLTVPLLTLLALYMLTHNILYLLSRGLCVWVWWSGPRFSSDVL